MRSGRSSPSSYSSMYTLVDFPEMQRPSMVLSKWIKLEACIFYPTSILYGFALGLSLNPSIAAFLDLIFGVVATKWALANNIISLKLSNSVKLMSKSINGSSISSFRLDNCYINSSMEKSSIASLSSFNKNYSIYSWYFLNKSI